MALMLKDLGKENETLVPPPHEPGVLPTWLHELGADVIIVGGIGGGLIVTMPSLKELKNPKVKDYVKEFYSFGSDEPTENIMKVHKLLQHWTAGQHGVATWHCTGPVMANEIMLQRVIDYTHDKDIVKQTLNLKETK